MNTKQSNDKQSNDKQSNTKQSNDKQSNDKQSNDKQSNDISNNNKKFKKLECAPGSGINSYSCYNSDALLKLKDNWNSRHPDA